MEMHTFLLGSMIGSIFSNFSPLILLKAITAALEFGHTVWNSIAMTGKSAKESDECHRAIQIMFDSAFKTFKEVLKLDQLALAFHFIHSDWFKSFTAETMLRSSIKTSSERRVKLIET